MQWAPVGNLRYPGILVENMNSPEGRDFRTLPKEVTHIEKVPVYNMLPESEKQYALLTKESHCIVRIHWKWKAVYGVLYKYRNQRTRQFNSVCRGGSYPVAFR